MLPPPVILEVFELDELISISPPVKIVVFESCDIKSFASQLPPVLTVIFIFLLFPDNLTSPPVKDFILTSLVSIVKSITPPS